MTLTEIFKGIGNFGQHTGYNDKGSHHSYLDTYERLFSPFRKGCVFMEIGLAKGDSLRMWDEYFENSIILGVDKFIDFEKPEYKNTVTIFEGDATTHGFAFALRNNRFDIILDDASHVEADQIKTFNLLKDKMNKGGIYIVEDISNIDESISKFESLHDNYEIVDMRYNGVSDNCLVIYKF